VWSDGHKKARGDANYLTLWRLIPPAGYVAMGLLASTGAKEPPSYCQVGLWGCHEQVQLTHAQLCSRVMPSESDKRAMCRLAPHLACF
jgi:hypothetical protein